MDELAEDNLFEIFKYCDVVDIFNLYQTNKSIHKLMNGVLYQDRLWLILIERDLGSIAQYKLKNQSYYDLYQYIKTTSLYQATLDGSLAMYVYLHSIPIPGTNINRLEHEAKNSIKLLYRPNDGTSLSRVINNLKLHNYKTINRDNTIIWYSEHFISRCAEEGHFHILDWFGSKLPIHVYPRMIKIEYVVERGDVSMLEWLSNKTCRNGTKHMVPHSDLSKLAIHFNKLNVLIWMKDKGLNPTLNRNSANYAASLGHLDIVKWLYGDGIKCTKLGARMAGSHNHTHVYTYLSKLKEKIIPTKKIY
jgi:hypothetical protein